MTLKQANDIMHHPKDHWSHEIDDAKDTMIRAASLLCDFPDDLLFLKVRESIEVLLAMEDIVIEEENGRL